MVKRKVSKKEPSKKSKKDDKTKHVGKSRRVSRSGQANKRETGRQDSPGKSSVSKSSKSRQQLKPVRSRSSASEGGKFPVVGIGASAGGLEAFKQFLTGLPRDSGMAFVLIQHLDPKHESLMVDLLSRHTELPIVEVGNGMRVEPDHVYMIPPNTYIRLRGYDLFLDAPVPERGMRMSIDYFFRSLAEAQKERSICVVLSGTGSDGTLGLKEVKAAGGLVLAQQPESAEYDGMPRSAISTGLVDAVVPIDEMADTLVKLVRHPYIKDSETRHLHDVAPDHFRAVLQLLRAHTDYDFTCYKKGTLSRRIQRRMGIRHVEGLPEYIRLLRKDTEEIHTLFKDLLIGVTRFFRDKELWAGLSDAISKIVRDKKKPSDTIRVWVPGCATGEEAYSLAMLIFEELDRQKKALPVSIFGTDLDPQAIEFARTGAYPISVASEVCQRRVHLFFREEGERYYVKKRLREACVFAVQNVVTDPPFSNLDIISCRNLMIYLEADVQHKMVEMFHFALRSDGILSLGGSESVGRHTDIFEPVSKAARLYRKAAGSRKMRLQFPLVPTARERSLAKGKQNRLPARATLDLGEVARRALLERFAPAAALIDQHYEIHYIHGAVRHYFDFPVGTPTHNLIELCVEQLRTKLRGLIHRVLQEQQSGRITIPDVSSNGDKASVDIEVDPVVTGRRGDSMLLVSFTRHALSAATGDEQEDKDAKKRAKQSRETQHELTLTQQLEYELQATREDLQSTIEELESANEELKASNEEVMSMNEELQSTNEELETSREELQSLNEELTTVNNQLEDKVDELQSANDDLSNLLSSTAIATIFLDTDYRIRRFTPKAAELLHVIGTDIGRPITDIAPRLADVDLLADANLVLDQLIPVEKEVQTKDGRWFIRRILPYRTSENRIDGVVITLSDVTGLRIAVEKLEIRERQQAAIAKLGRMALSTENLDDLLEHAAVLVSENLNTEFVKILELLPEGDSLLLRAGVGWREGLVGTTTVPTGSDSQAGYSLQSNTPVIVEDLTTDGRFSTLTLLRDHDVVSGVSVVIGSKENPWGVLGAHVKSRRQFSNDDINFVHAVANVIAEATQRLEIDRQRRERLREVSLLQKATVAVAAAPALRAGLERCIGVICELARWPVGHAYLVSDTGETMVPADIWYVQDPSAADAMKRHTRGVDFRRGEGFIGEVWESEELVWIQDLNRYPQFKRKKMHYDAGVRAAFGIPIKAGDGIAAILEFFAFEERRPDGDILSLVRTVGEQVGRLLERRFAEQTISATAERLKLALTAGDMGTWDWDLESNVQHWSNEFFEMLGLDAGSIPPSYEAWRERVHPEDIDRLEKSLDHARGHGDFREEYRVIWPDGTVRWLEARGRIHLNSEGHRSHLYGVLLDRTTRRQYEDALREKSVALEKADKHKNEFLAILGHELRNPLAGVQNAATLLEHVRDNAQKHDRTREIILNQCEQLSRLLDDLLDYTRISQGKITLKRDFVAIKAVVKSATESTRPLMETKRQRFEMRISKNATLYADPTRAAQILANLLNNASRYSDEGAKISLHVDVSKDCARFTVTDEGRGFTESQAELLFKPFSDVGKGELRRDGLGIGLKLVKELAQLHGGSVSASSGGLGQGSKFVVELPLAEQVPREGRSKGRKLPKKVGLNLFLVDDNADGANSLAELLRLRGCTVRTFYDGENALEALYTDKPDAMIVDIGLPGLSGYQVAEQVRGNGISDVRLIALTGYGHQEAQDKARSAGFDHHLAKPASAEQVLILCLEPGGFDRN